MRAREGRSTIDAVQFDEDPPPEYVGKEPNELPFLTVPTADFRDRCRLTAWITSF